MDKRMRNFIKQKYMINSTINFPKMKECFRLMSQNQDYL